MFIDDLLCTLASLHFTTLRDDDRYLGLVVWPGGHVFNLSHNQHAVNDSAEDDMLSIEKVTLGAGDEELTAV